MKWFKSVFLSSSDTSRFQCLSAYIKVGLTMSELGEPTSSLSGPARGKKKPRQLQRETAGLCCSRTSATKVSVEGHQNPQNCIFDSQNLASPSVCLLQINRFLGFERPPTTCVRRIMSSLLSRAVIPEGELDRNAVSV